MSEAKRQGHGHRQVEVAGSRISTLCRTFQKSQGVENGEWISMKEIPKSDTKSCFRQVSPCSLSLARDSGQYRNVANEKREGRRAEVHPEEGG